MIGAVADLPFDASDVLQGLIRQPWNQSAAEFVETACAKAVIEPLSDQQGTGDYRRAMAGVVARRAIASAHLRIIG